MSTINSVFLFLTSLCQVTLLPEGDDIWFKILQVLLDDEKNLDYNKKNSTPCTLLFLGGNGVKKCPRVLKLNFISRLTLQTSGPKISASVKGGLSGGSSPVRTPIDTSRGWWTYSVCGHSNLGLNMSL